jgi:hypothetical protein
MMVQRFPAAETEASGGLDQEENGAPHACPAARR